MSRTVKWIIGIVVAGVVAVFGGAYVYTHFIENPPPELTFDDLDGGSSSTTSGHETDDTSGSDDPAAGDADYVVASDSQVGYRVSENLFGQDTEAVGRTNGVEGGIQLDGTTVSAASFTVDMTTVSSDRSQRDGQFRGRIMSTDQFPTATFELTEPIELDSLPADGDEVTVSATGDLTLRGVTNSVTFDLTARLQGSNVQISAQIPLDFDAFEIPDASGGPAQVGRDGTLEVLLDLEPAS